VRQRSPVGGKYDTAINRESAEERLAVRASEKIDAEAPPVKRQGKAADGDGGGWTGGLRDAVLGTSRRQGMLEAAAKSMIRAAGTRAGLEARSFQQRRRAGRPRVRQRPRP